MAATYKVVYKNHCTPQEKVSFSSGERWYLDSDCGKKMTGSCEPGATFTTTYYGTGTLAGGGNVPLESSREVNFVFVKNTGDNALTINLNAAGAFIQLLAGESFASEICKAGNPANGCTVRLDSTSGTTYEYFLGDIA